MIATLGNQELTVESRGLKHAERALLTAWPEWVDGSCILRGRSFGRTRVFSLKCYENNVAWASSVLKALQDNGKKQAELYIFDDPRMRIHTNVYLTKATQKMTNDKLNLRRSDLELQEAIQKGAAYFHCPNWPSMPFTDRVKFSGNPDLGTAFTLHGWVYRLPLTLDSQRLLDAATTGWVGWILHLAHNPGSGYSNTFAFWTSVWGSTRASGEPVPVNKWVHIGVTYLSGGSPSLVYYVNGQEVNEWSWPSGPIPVPTQGWSIGNMNQDGNYDPLNGYVYDWRAYTRRKTATEMAEAARNIFKDESSLLFDLPLDWTWTPRTGAFSVSGKTGSPTFIRIP